MLFDFKTEVGCCIRNKEEVLKISVRFKDDDTPPSADSNSSQVNTIPGSADPGIVLTWDEFFMGLAKLQCVYCNDNDRNPGKRV